MLGHISTQRTRTVVNKMCMEFAAKYESEFLGQQKWRLVEKHGKVSVRHQIQTILHVNRGELARLTPHDASARDHPAGHGMNDSVPTPLLR